MLSSRGAPDASVTWKRQGAVIRFEATQDTAQISIDANGNICYPDAKGNSQPTGSKFEIMEVTRTPEPTWPITGFGLPSLSVTFV